MPGAQHHPSRPVNKVLPCMTGRPALGRAGWPGRGTMGSKWAAGHVAIPIGPPRASAGQHAHPSVVVGCRRRSWCPPALGQSHLGGRAAVAPSSASIHPLLSRFPSPPVSSLGPPVCSPGRPTALDDAGGTTPCGTTTRQSRRPSARVAWARRVSGAHRFARRVVQPTYGAPPPRSRARCWCRRHGLFSFSHQSPSRPHAQPEQRLARGGRSNSCPSQSRCSPVLRAMSLAQAPRPRKGLTGVAASVHLSLIFSDHEATPCQRGPLPGCPMPRPPLGKAAMKRHQRCSPQRTRSVSCRLFRAHPGAAPPSPAGSSTSRSSTSPSTPGLAQTCQHRRPVTGPSPSSAWPGLAWAEPPSPCPPGLADPLASLHRPAASSSSANHGWRRLGQELARGGYLARVIALPELLARPVTADNFCELGRGGLV